MRGPYRPLTTLSYALNYALDGPAVAGYHLVNLALHALASLLVAALALHLARAASPSRAPRIALLAGLLFAVHPAHVEAVVTLSGRAEPLSAVLALSALLLALKWGGSVLRLLLALVLLSCAVLAMEMAATLPALYLLVAFTVPEAAGLFARPGFSGPKANRALLRSLAVAAFLCLAGVPYLLGHGPSLAVAPQARWFPVGTPPWHVALTMSRVLAEYLRILVFPLHLGGDFAYAAQIPTLAGPTFGFAVATVAWFAALSAGFFLLRRAPLASLGLLFIFVALLPVLQIVPLGVLLAERLLYLPSAGFCLFASSALDGFLPAPGMPLWRRPQGEGQRLWMVRLLLALVPVAYLVFFGARTVLRTLDFGSAVSYWESEVLKAPLEVEVNNNLAVAYTSRGEPQKAIPRLETALAEHPGYWRAWVNLGIARQALGERGSALHAFETALRLAPAAADPPRFLSRLLEQEGDLAGAAQALEQARKNAPEQASLARELGAVLLKAGRSSEARAALSDAVRLDPADREARALLQRAGP